MKYSILAILFALLNWTGLRAQSISEVSEENPLDLTSLIANAACQNASGWLHHSGEQAGTGGNNYAKNVALFNSNDYSGIGIESWTSKPVTDTDLIYQDVNLPAGSYEMSACVVAQVYVSDTQHGANNGGVSLFMGDQQTECTTNTWQRITMKVTLSKNGVVRIGVRAGAANKNTWVSLADVHLKMTSLTGSLQPLALNEKYDIYPLTSGILADVSLYKYIPNDRFIPLCIPVDLSAAKTSELFKSVLTITAAKQNGDQIDITTKKATSIEAGKVYIVKAKKAELSLLNFGPMMIGNASPEVTTYGSITLKGTYRVYDHIANSYMLNADGTAFIPAEGRGLVKGYGAFMTTEK